MYVSFFSIAVAVFWTTVFTKLIALFRKQTQVLQYFSLSVLLSALLLCVVRILFPLELPFTIILESWKIMPMIQDFLCTPLFFFGELTINAATIVLSIWISGATIILLKHISHYHRFRHLLGMLPATDDSRLSGILAVADLHDRMRHIRIIIHASIESPAIVGFIRPVLILPDIHFDDDELLGIFIHELVHFRFKHHLIRLAVEMVCICFWWNPFLKELFSETVHAMEMHSDKIVCANLTREQQKKYLTGMIKVLQNMKHKNILPGLSSSLTEDADSEKLQQRFRMILENQYNRNQKSCFFVILLILFIFLLSYVYIPQPCSDPTAAEFGNVDIPSDPNYYCIETKEGYELYEYPDHYIGYMDKIEEHMQWLPIYKNIEEAKRK